MRTTRQWALAVLATGLLLVAGAAAVSAQEAEAPLPWQRLYTGEEATGEHVVALWHFDAGAETEDASGNGHTLKLQGESRFVKDGRFGAGLECFPAIEDKSQGTVTARRDDLTPSGPFTIELWFKPKPDFQERRAAFLLDCKYVHYKHKNDRPQYNKGYSFRLEKFGDKWQPMVHLGFGTESESYTGKPVSLEAGVWYHIAFTYDGAGTGRHYLNGERIGERTCEGRGPAAPPAFPLCIGDRAGSIHHGFPAYIDQVRISKRVVPLCTGKLLLDTTGGSGRTAFVRMEKGAYIQVSVRNDTGKALENVVAKVGLARGQKRVPLPDLEPDAASAIDVPVDTTVRPGRYELAVSVSGDAADGKRDADTKVQVVIVPRPLPHRMPVVLWGSGDLERVKEIGFTHQLVHMIDYGSIWQAGQPTEAMQAGPAAGVREKLNTYLCEGMGAAVYCYPGRWIVTNKDTAEKYQRIDREGKPYDSKHANACGLFPEAQTFAYNTGASVARSFGHFPALQACLIHSEIRDSTNVCFHDHDKKAFQEYAGRPVPKQVKSKAFQRFDSIPGFPKNQIVPDNDPILKYYRWFWREGDGWNKLHTLMSEGMKSTGRRDLWTFFDPAVRVPSVWGSGGRVDVISQWTYCYPDPIKIGQATDELFAMADGRPGQKVMKMTQIIWYRRQTAPTLPKDESKHAQWEKEIPDAQFITIAPDHMREAFWSKISRPVQGIMYHGWGSLVRLDKPRGYRFTNPHTAGVLTELVRDVVRPLGPTLLQVPDPKRDVAFLESFASQLYAGAATWGWSHNWTADMHLALQWAQIQPRIIYDETILRDGLAGFRVLVMPACAVLTQSVARQIEEFQNRGGILVADEKLTPAIVPDIVMASYKRTGEADEDKAALQAKAAALRKELDEVYERDCDSSSPDVVVRRRQYRTTDYLFALNDKRTFGKYVGHHGKVMEKGLPCSARLSIKREQGYVYDLLLHRPVQVMAASGELRFAARLGPGAGTVFMVTQRKMASVRMQMPAQGSLGKSVAIDVAVLGDDEQPLDAVVPVQVDILDPKGRPAEFSGYYGAKDGKLSIKLNLASNDLAGQWTVRAKELASGLSAERKLAVTP